MIKEKKSCPIYSYDQEDKENISLFRNITPVKNFSHNTSINKSSNNKSQPRSPLSDITRRETGSKKSHSHVCILIRNQLLPSFLNTAMLNPIFSLFVDFN